MQRNTGEDKTELGRNPNTKGRMEIDSLEVGIGILEGRQMVLLCDSSGGSCCNGSSLRADFSGRGGRGSGWRVSRLLSSRLVGWAFPRDVTGLRALVADLAGRAQWATVGSSAVTRDVTLGIVRWVFINIDSSK